MFMSRYVLKVINQNEWIKEYYTGNSYIYQYNKYAIVDKDVNKAKMYSSKKRAINATKMSFANYEFEVEEVKED